MNGNKYQSTIKVEFRDLIKHLLESNRKSFHMYTIHRVLSLGLLIDFPFEYQKVDDPNQVGIELDLGEHGKVMFIVDIESNYAKVATEGYREVLQRFLENFDVCLDKNVKKKKKGFLK